VLPFLGEGTVMRDVFTGAMRAVSAGGIRLAEAHAEFPGSVLEYERGEIGAASH
jgi:hypothetical protein